MEAVSTGSLNKFLILLGERFQQPVDFYLIGGGALLLLGSPRETLDIDYLYTVESDLTLAFQKVVDELAAELHLDLEWVPLAEFIPLPPGAMERRQFLGEYGKVRAYIFDLYSIALSKIARGFESDLEDVIFLLKEHRVEFAQLEKCFEAILPHTAQSDIVPDEFRKYFSALRQKWYKTGAG